MIVSGEMARAAAACVLQSARFKTSPRLSRLLQFLVDETIDGRGGSLKGYAIGLEVFDKRDDFDPSQDPIVRVQMGRLRQALELYYHDEGAADPVRIRLTKGSYVAEFAVAPAQEDPNRDDRNVGPRVPTATVPSETPSTGFRSETATSQDGLSLYGLARARGGRWLPHTTALLVVALSVTFAALSGAFGPRDRRDQLNLGAVVLQPDIWRPKIRVFASQALAGQDGQARHFKSAILGGLSTYAVFDTLSVAQETPAPSEFDRAAILTLAIIDTPDGKDLTLRLTDEVVKRIVWATTASAMDLDIETKEGRQPSANKILRHILQQRGVILTHLAGRENLDPRLACVVKSGFAISFRDTQPAVVAYAKTCLAQMIQGGGAAPVAKSFYANLHLPPFDMTSPPETALRLALEATNEAPRNALVQRAMMAAYWNSGQVEPALRAGRNAVALNPLNSDVAAAFGFRLITSGAFRDGLDTLSKAMKELLPGDTCWDLGIFLGHLGLGQDAMAAAVGAGLPRSDKADLAAARIVSLKLLGRDADAREDLRMFALRFPKHAAAPHAAFNTLRLGALLNDRLRSVLASVR